MSVEISSIQDQTLRHAAEVADLNDNTANSGKLDQNELSVFIREAVNSNCDCNAIAELCEQVGLSKASNDVKASMEKLTQLQKLEKELKYQKDLLQKRNDEIKELEQSEISYNQKKNAVMAVTTTGGAIIGTCLGGFPGMLLGGAAGGMLGWIGKQFIPMPIDETKKIQTYEEQKRPLEDNIQSLQGSINKVKATL